MVSIENNLVQKCWLRSAEMKINKTKINYNLSKTKKQNFNCVLTSTKKEME